MAYPVTKNRETVSTKTKFVSLTKLSRCIILEATQEEGGSGSFVEPVHFSQLRKEQQDKQESHLFGGATFESAFGDSSELDSLGICGFDEAECCNSLFVSWFAFSFSGSAPLKEMLFAPSPDNLKFGQTKHSYIYWSATALKNFSAKSEKLMSILLILHSGSLHTLLAHLIHSYPFTASILPVSFEEKWQCFSSKHKNKSYISR